MKHIIYIYGYIVNEEEKFSPDEPAFSLKDLNEHLDNMADEVDEIEVRINSGGGFVHEGFAIADKLRASGKKIITVAEGMVASIASIIYLAGSERRIYENSKVFIHNPNWISFMDTMEAKDAEALAKSLRDSEKDILDYYEKHTTSSRQQLKDMMDEGTEMDAKKAKAYGFATSIIKEKITAKREYKIAACISKQSLKTTDMDIKEQKTMFEKFEATLNKVAKMFKPKNEMVETDNGTLYFEGELAVDTMVYSDEEMTEPAADGVYTFDGNAYTVVDGAVTEVTAVEEEADEEVENLKTANAALEAKLKELEGQLEAKTGENEKIQNSLKTTQSEFLKLKNTVFGEDPDKGERTDKGDTDKPNKLDSLANKAKSTFAKRTNKTINYN